MVTDTDPTPIGDTAGYWRQRAEQAAERAAASQPAVPERQDDVDELETAAHEARWTARIPPRYQAARIELVDDPDLAVLAGWDRSCNVLILGNVGAGKTHAAVALARLAHDDGRQVLFANTLSLIDDLKPHGDPTAMDRALAADLLLLDDFGSERDTDFAVDRIARIVVERYDHCRPTIVTSNLDPGGFERLAGPRIFSRLFHGSLRVKTAGPDRRRSAA